MKDQKTYNSWRGMKERCGNPNHKDYLAYGGRGIFYEPRWKKYNNFVADMGIRPEGCTLERIDNQLGYTKANCRWATSKDQAHNKPNTVLTQQMADCIRYARATSTLNNRQLAKQLSEIFSVNISTILNVLNGIAWVE